MKNGDDFEDAAREWSRLSAAEQEAAMAQVKREDRWDLIGRVASRAILWTFVIAYAVAGTLLMKWLWRVLGV